MLLQESQVLDLRVDLLRSTAAILLELRAAFDHLTGNTAVMVLRGAGAVRWMVADEVGEPLTAWAVVGASIRQLTGGFEVSLGLSPNAELMVTAQALEYYSLEANVGEVIPDYTIDSEETIRSAVAGWESIATPREFSSLALTKSE
ncbi:hypothetical protein ACFO1B_42705 [Dactylosporangium siamense]|uniref:Uncharacterized protein n=1 Tax=Dactylosporangium siamense TaxID=685454 RepID=A0A919PZH4_9ACTN|nr:hypothetical protein [Dactylosporangium siamense]GIG51140.1 hypothetical protein Dsi01nite_091810 [Dactylosporangium siamense]